MLVARRRCHVQLSLDHLVAVAVVGHACQIVDRELVHRSHLIHLPVPLSSLSTNMHRPAPALLCAGARLGRHQTGAWRCWVSRLAKRAMAITLLHSTGEPEIDRILN